ncbi:MAG: primosomal protein N' [Nitrospirales bacterium]|nr:primosomal protein N' [Nitrospira sp.]MDR4500666.1 primosomal protein N' [Nitrospirales bacterium]
MFADIVFPQRRFQVFTYRIPQGLIDRIQVGSRVLVPFGKSSARGLVCDVLEDFPVSPSNKRVTPQTLREISAIVDFPSQPELDPSLLKLANQVGEYYLAPPGAALRLVLPPVPANRIAKRMVLTDAGRHALNHGQLSAEQTKVLTRLMRKPKGLTLPTLLKTVDGKTSAMTGLKRRKFVEEVEWVRDTDERTQPAHSGSILGEPEAFYGREDARDIPERELTTLRKSDWYESDWWKRVGDALSSQAFEECLIHMPATTSRRVLFDVIDRTRQGQRTVLVLCPEIQQVLRMVEALKEAGYERVAMYHGDLSVSVRVKTWQAIQCGQFEVVVGTRLAVFVPLASLGVIWVDQEESPSFQEERSPHFHARNVARMRAQQESATLIVQSVHPSLETAWRLGYEPGLNALESGRLELVNLRLVPYGTMLSDPMRTGIQETLNQNGQVILFLNRKGYARSLLCRDCGYRPQCTTCGVALVLHQRPVRLRCAYCGQQHVSPVVCPSCQSVKLESLGYGTEQLEAVVQKEYPDAVVARYDREVVKTTSQERELVQKFRGREIDILIGTEFLFHAIDLPRVQFVGIPHADGGLHFPDFRAAERTYHRLQEAVQFLDEGPASRAVVQTWLPAHHVMQAIAQQDPAIFYREELQIREALHYPPYSRLVQVAITGKRPEAVQAMAQHCRERIVRGMESNGLSDDILGPLISTNKNGPGLTRAVLIVKDFGQALLQEKLRALQKDLAPALREQALRMEMKVDPFDLN